MTTENQTAALAGKIRIQGRLRIETGLHIGGSSKALQIGGLDLDVIKTGRGVPYIPGSSFKGKLRSMLAFREGSPEVKRDGPNIQALFGGSGDGDERPLRGRLIVRDAYLDAAHFHRQFSQEDLQAPFLEHKTENRIDRSSGAAKDPRTQSRVPAGAEFDFVLLFDVWQEAGDPFVSGRNRELMEELLLAMRLLEDDYLGGSGTRGYGQVRFLREALVFSRKTIADYEDPAGDWSVLDAYQLSEEEVVS